VGLPENNAERSFRDQLAQAAIQKEEAIRKRRRLVRGIESKLCVPGNNLIEALEDDGPRILAANALVRAAQRDSSRLQREAKKRGIVP
jgi:hypothetical protein